MRPDTHAPQVSGIVSPGFEGVLSAFVENLASGEELGGSFAAYRDGEAVIDIWGGKVAKDVSAEVASNSLYSVFSATKGIVAICIAVLVDRGKLNYDEPVAQYWPDFGKNGKATITVGELMSHQSGLVGARTAVTMEDFYAHNEVAALLAEQKPYFEPGVWGYHAFTFGTLADELVRRTDGRTAQQFFSDELARDLGGDVFMGLPFDEDRRHVGAAGVPERSTQYFDPPNFAAFTASMTNPVIDWDSPNQRAFREHGQPGSGASANARGLAKLYGSLVCENGANSAPLLSQPVFKEATRERISGVDQCSGGVARYAAGFRLNVGGFGSSPTSFGHPGLGGSVGFADPARRLGVGYATCRMINPHWQWTDRRLGRLLVALYAADSTA